MNKRIKKLWVAALRSGKYKQGQDLLRKNGTFCCLGVLCNLHAQEHLEIAAREIDPNVYLGCSELPPTEVTRWAEMSENPEVYIGGSRNHLSEHNDNGISFSRIAKAIEDQL